MPARTDVAAWLAAAKPDLTGLDVRDGTTLRRLRVAYNLWVWNRLQAAGGEDARQAAYKAREGASLAAFRAAVTHSALAAPAP